jgi:hypothetical protein
MHSFFSCKIPTRKSNIFNICFVLNTVFEVVMYKVRRGSAPEINCNVDPGFG